jgi:hypothetical protein
MVKWFVILAGFTFKFSAGTDAAVQTPVPTIISVPTPSSQYTQTTENAIKSVVNPQIHVGDDHVEIMLKRYPATNFSLYKRLDQVDSTISPGKSFYHYANNPWLAKVTIPKDQVIK